MEIIEFNRWKPCADDPRKVEYAGQRTAQEVYEELMHRLDGMGYLPDEYFLLRDEWKNGREIPRDADLFCTVDYGASEGVYVDVYLKWYDEKQKKSVTESFIVGKTLGENGNDLDRMFLTASAITKAVHGDLVGTSFISLAPPHAAGLAHCAVPPLPTKPKVGFAGAPSKPSAAGSMGKGGAREQTQFSPQAETEWSGLCDDAGQRPLRISDFDKAQMAIRDSETKVFKELWPKVRDHANELLVEAATRSGHAARRMVDVILAGTEQFPDRVYRAACQKAIDNADDAMLNTLLTQAEQRMEGYTPAFWGEAAHYGYGDKGWFARQIVDWCSSEQIAAAPSALLLDAVRQNDYPTAWKLAEGGISADACFADIVGFCAANGRPQMADDLLRQGARVSPDNFGALHACIDHGCTELGKHLLDQGMDFEQYREWSPRDLSQRNSYRAIEEHWNELQAQAQGLEQEQADAPGMGGMTLG